jgi:NDP-sugar pyrophosphorylase family protein
LATSDYTLIVAAAGEGSRLREISDGTAKPLVDLAGKPIMEWSLTRFETFPPHRVVVVANPDWLRTALVLTKRVLPMVETVGVRQPEPFGTLDALRRALSEADGHQTRVVFLHADNILPEPVIAQGLDALKDRDTVIFSRVTPWAGTSARLIRGTGGRPVGLARPTIVDPGGEPEICGGVFFFGSWIWNRFGSGEPPREGEEEIDSLVDELIRAGRALVLPAEGTWLHINTPDDYQRAQAALQL